MSSFSPPLLNPHQLGFSPQCSIKLLLRSLRTSLLAIPVVIAFYPHFIRVFIWHSSFPSLAFCDSASYPTGCSFSSSCTQLQRLMCPGLGHGVPPPPCAHTLLDDLKGPMTLPTIYKDLRGGSTAPTLGIHTYNGPLPHRTRVGLCDQSNITKVTGCHFQDYAITDCNFCCRLTYSWIAWSREKEASCQQPH